MKAITLKTNGGIENLTLAEISTPAIQQDEVLVKVKAIGINPVDAFVRQNPEGFQFFLKPKAGEDTYILGWDISGTVVKVGDKVTEFKEGDDVFGMVNFAGHGKAYAEYVAAPSSHLAIKPRNISYDEAAAATLAALTAYQALVTHAKIKKGEKVLIHAAAGGVGHYAVQIAKHLGAYVIGTASESKREFVFNLGADEVIDYTKEKFEDRVKDLDVVIDSIYGNHILRSIDAVKAGGRVISLLAFIDGKVAEKVNEKGVYAQRMVVTSNGMDIREIAKFLENGAVKSHISSKYSFSDLPKAHQEIEKGKTVGKIVVSLP